MNRILPLIIDQVQNRVALRYLSTIWWEQVMKHPIARVVWRNLPGFSPIAGLVASAIALTATGIYGQSLPTDVQMLVPASNATLSFTDWFKNHNPGTVNAEAVAADSLHFSDLPNADFYRWSYQMFLWLTSPAQSTYGGTGRVFSSPEFFNVSPPDPVTGDRTLSRNAVNPLRGLSAARAAAMRRKVAPPVPLELGLRVANLGPNGFPFVQTKDGRFLEVLPVAKSASGLPLITDAQGRQVEIVRAKVSGEGADRRLQFFARDGRQVDAPQVETSRRFRRMLERNGPAPRRLDPERFIFKIDADTARRLNLSKLPIFLGRGGTVIDPEIAESDGNIQMTQAGALIYYGIAVNDVYAYFLTGQKDMAISATHFPVNATDLAAITSFAGAHSHTFLNPNALAVEIKTSWVEASAVADPSQYITMNARVPIYDRTDPTHWVQTGNHVVKVALLGMHVVGSTKGHPEMIWASFEHVGNTPNVGYDYANASNGTSSQPADPLAPSASWLFAGASVDPFPFKSHASAGGSGDIVPGNAGGNIGPTSAQRQAPWGAPNNHAPNPLSSAARSNAEIVSLNKDVRNQMNAADVRNNYLFIGATWTVGGASPTTNFNTSIAQNVVGTNHLANSTLETFTQSPVFVTGTFPGPGCLSCHDSNTVDTSHIFFDLKPLF
jgi:hypothetical protein